MNRKTIISISALLVVLIAVFAGWYTTIITTTTTTLGEPFRLTQHLWPGYYHSYIAKDQGFFAEGGVNVEITLIEEIDANLQAFVDGKADAAFGLQSDAYLLASKGVRLKIVYIADFSHGGDVVISKPEIQTVSDLRGKTVSVDKLNGFNHIFLAELLKFNGLTEEDVKIIPLKGSEVPAALQDGRIDAGQTWEPYKSKALAQGNRLLATTADAPGIVTDVLMVKTDVIEKREKDVRAVVKALFKALKFRTTNESISYAIMSEATGTPPGSLRDVIQGGNIFPDLEENKQAFIKSKQPTSLYESGQFISDFFVKHGVVDRPINLSEVHAPEIVNSLK